VAIHEKRENVGAEKKKGERMMMRRMRRRLVKCKSWSSMKLVFQFCFRRKALLMRDKGYE